MSEFVDCSTCKTDCVRADGNYGYTFCDKYTHPPMTNADRIRSMTDEELAVFLADADAEHCHVSLCKDGETCRICCLRWLQQPYREEYDYARFEAVSVLRWGN